MPHREIDERSDVGSWLSYLWLVHFCKNDGNVVVNGWGIPIPRFNLSLGLDNRKIPVFQIYWQQLEQPNGMVILIIQYMFAEIQCLDSTNKHMSQSIAPVVCWEQKTCDRYESEFCTVVHVRPDKMICPPCATAANRRVNEIPWPA